MLPFTNTRSGPTTSAEATKTSSLNSPYVKQTDFATTISNTTKYLLANFDTKHTKQDANV